MKRLVGAIVLMATFASCSSKSSVASADPPEDGHGVEHEDEAQHASMATKLRLPTDVLKASGVRVETAQMEALSPVVELTGEIASDPDATADVTVRSAGRIVDVRFKEGDRVAKGALLAVVESADIAHTRANLLAATAKARTARENAERITRLAEKGLAAGQDASNAQSEATALEAELQASQQSLSATGGSTHGAARLELHAPITGDVLKRDGVLGQAVPQDHVLASIANLDSAYFLGRLFEKDVARVQAKTAAEVRLNAYPHRIFLGEVEAVGKRLDPISRTVIARIRVKDEAGALKVGLFGTARVVIPGGSTGPSRVVVPLSAVTRIAKGNAVFVQHEDGDFEMHPVTLGRSASGKTEVLTGLRPGEAVVVDGVFTLKSALLKSTFTEED